MKGVDAMKRLMQGVVVAVTIFAILCPMMVKADKLPLNGELYSKTAVVGSEIVFSIEVGDNDFEGNVSFDSSVLEVVNVTAEYSGSNDVVSGSSGTINKTINGNELNIDFKAGDFPVNLLVTFKVKAYPSNGQVTVKASSNGNSWFGEPEETIAIAKENECSTCENDCPVCEECETTNSINSDNNASVADNTLLYVSFGISGVLALAVVILAITKKQ